MCSRDVCYVQTLIDCILHTDTAYCTEYTERKYRNSTLDVSVTVNLLTYLLTYLLTPWC